MKFFEQTEAALNAAQAEGDTDVEVSIEAVREWIAITRQLAEQRAELLAALTMARAYIAVRCGTPDPADRYADQVLIEIHKTIDATISKCEAAK